MEFIRKIRQTRIIEELVTAKNIDEAWNDPDWQGETEVEIESTEVLSVEHNGWQDWIQFKDSAGGRPAPMEGSGCTGNGWWADVVDDAGVGVWTVQVGARVAAAIYQVGRFGSVQWKRLIQLKDATSIHHSRRVIVLSAVQCSMKLILIGKVIILTK
jgi:hypothetical protein